jgi:hypothetical protein
MLYPNGRVPTSVLQKGAFFRAVDSITTPSGAYLQAEAARQQIAFQNAFFLKFKRPLYVSDSYRSIEEQQERRDLYLYHGGALAAVVGTSVHGWALASDFASGVEQYGTPAKVWADENGPLYGWFPIGNSFSRREPWHFEYRGGAKLIAPRNIKAITKLPSTPQHVTPEPPAPTDITEGQTDDMFAAQLISASTGAHAGSLPKGALFLIDVREKTLVRVDNHSGASKAKLVTLRDEWNTIKSQQRDGLAIDWSGDVPWRYIDGGYSRTGSGF